MPRKNRTKGSKSTSGGRRPTYGAALRLARLVLELHDRPTGWAYDRTCEELGVNERTLARYLAACRSELLDRADRPIIEEFKRGERRYLRLAARETQTDPTAYQVASLFFQMALARFLQGTVLEQGSEDVLERVRRSMPAHLRPRLDSFDRKLFALPHAPKEYRDKDEELDVILKALLHEHRLTIEYDGLVGNGARHEFDPYTLVGYRGGLYLLGRSRRHGKIVWLAIDRIRSVEPMRDGEGRITSFTYPRGFRPERHTNGMFGVVEGEETEVEIAIENAETEAYLRERRLHATQRFAPGEDGRTRLHLRVRGTAELANWAMGMMPYVEVLHPAELRAEIRRRMVTALARHDPPRRRPAEAVALRALPAESPRKAPSGRATRTKR